MRANIQLKLALWEAGMSQRALAARVGVHESLISLIACGRYNPDPVQQGKIARVLGRSVQEIFGG